MDRFRKVVLLGTVPETRYHRSLDKNLPVDAKVFCRIEWDNKLNPKRPLSLSICGVVGPQRNGDSIGGCGQVVFSLKASDFNRFYEGWDAAKVERFLQLWDRWRLNDMNAGSPRQEQWLRDHKAEWEAARNDFKGDHFTWAKARLTEAGLQPDREHLVDIGRTDEQKQPLGPQPYSYGSSWLRDEVPEDVLQWLHDLPDAAEECPWTDL